MIEQLTRPITIDVFKPNNSNRELSSAQRELFETFYGREGQLFCEMVQDEGRRSHSLDLEYVGENVDERFFSTLRHYYNLGTNVDPQAFYLRQQSHAVQTIKYIVGKAFPEQSHRLGLKNEIEWYSDSPKDFLEILSLPNVDPTLRFQVMRHLALAHISGSIDARTRKGSLRTELAHIQRFLNKNLYDGVYAEGNAYTVYSIHDNQTNEVKEVVDKDPRAGLGEHIKEYKFNARSVDGRPVLTNPRKKEDPVSVLKALVKALDKDNGNGGEIVPDQDVRDSLGIMFVAMDDRRVEDLMYRVMRVLDTYPGKKAFIDDHFVDNNRGQSQQMKFSRFQMELANGVVPVELVFYDRKDFLNQEYEVGEKVDGIYKGRSHRLYEPRRIRSVLPVLFPPEIYSFNTEEFLLERMDKIAEELRGSNRLT